MSTRYRRAFNILIFRVRQLINFTRMLFHCFFPLPVCYCLPLIPNCGCRVSHYFVFFRLTYFEKKKIFHWDCNFARTLYYHPDSPPLLWFGGGGCLVMVMLNDNYPHNPTVRILIVMRVLTVSTNVLSVNYTDEQGQVSAPFFTLSEMVEV